MTIVRPDGDVTCSLTPSTGTSHYALLDEETLDTGDCVYLQSPAQAYGNATGSDLLSCATFTKSGTISTVDGWFYLGNYFQSGSSGGAVSFTLKLYTGTTQLATADTSSTGWQSVTYTGDLTQSEIDGLRLYVYMSVSSSHVLDGYNKEGAPIYSYYSSIGYCYMAYAEVTGGWSNILKVKGATATDLLKVSGVAVADIAKYKGVAV